MSALGHAILRRANLALTDGEDVLWIGRPVPGNVMKYSLRVAVVSLVLLGATGLGYVLDVWATVASEADGALKVLSPTWFELVGSVLVFVTLVAGGAVLWSKWIAPLTWYGVTTRRLLFIQGRSAASVWLGAYDLMTIQLVEHPDGTADLLFRRKRTDYDPAAGRLGAPPPGVLDEIEERMSGRADEQELDAAFLGLRDAPAVRDLILRSYRSRG
jgi:hypothetical protein